ncbi:unnamed protein product [Parascedosporium putredinis]|uniref:Uncharacterized protein n=1 Tax=Parascedosporium putredinis TaxID=1442378 RepID=A0A9P1GZI2_9PEZI|nr:unnamed protein product [Parascedosporium putredinis]CAI7992904.1 unnamed protein product [Parascedosporium putredinis]
MAAAASPARHSPAQQTISPESMHLTMPAMPPIRSPVTSIAPKPVRQAPSPAISHSPAISKSPAPQDDDQLTSPIGEVVEHIKTITLCFREAFGSRHGVDARLRCGRVLCQSAGNLQDVVASSSGAAVSEYQKLIATGLSCLESTLQSSRLTPRQEAKIRLRYASILYEDTESLMEAETALSKGIKLCDKHRFLDLKYSMAYLQAKLLFQRGHTKGALHAADRMISEIASRHVHWNYAFRFLKASFYLQSGSSSDGAALENLRTIGTFANGRGTTRWKPLLLSSKALLSSG